ncbi:MAG: DUF4340 domain-containing protein [Treponema sp.]|jgi:hypothetical protein|nr:DUF4340 domain-containing protein [Treponema sp.]
MAYRKKLIILSSIIAVLALVYVLTVFFEPERAGARDSAFTWLDPGLKERIDRITLNSQGNLIELARNGGKWFVSREGKEYPAKDLRVDDFIAILGRKAPYPVRASSAAAHERLGLAENDASRITVSGGAGLPLLDLLVGAGDQTGREVYLRRQGGGEVRSGEDKFTAYISGSALAWFNLRLFPESENGGLDIDGVQRVTVYASALSDSSAPEPQVFTRAGREWALSGVDVENPDTGKIDAYVRGILNIEGDDFADSADAGAPEFNAGRIALELGDGSVKTIRLTAPDESNRRLAAVSGSPWVYSLSGWSTERLFREASFFEKEQ